MADKGKILVVDDDRLVVVTLTYGLSQAGYDVIAADNGDDAIQMARERRPAMALLDIQMEGKSGFEVAAVLRDQCRIPFMFLSGFSDDETRRKVKALGALAHLVKPLDIKKIVPAVDAAFSSLNARRAAALAARPRTEAAGNPEAMSPPGRPKGEYRSAQHEGTPMSPPGRHRPEADGLRQATGSPQGLPVSGLSPKGEYRSAQHEGTPMTAAVAMAVGVLMHRYSLARAPALERLRRMAQTHGQTVAEHAERILEAVELLSPPSRQ